MKCKNIVSLVLLTLLVFLTSCGILMKRRNIQNLKLLRKGMTEIEVLAVMGDPLKEEVYHQEDVWFYFTESQWSDGSITRDECTPLFFKNGVLAGWGQKAYKKFRQSDWE